MEFKCLKKCGERCQRRIGVVLITLFALVSIGGLLQVLINIA
jgi:hypothetical protein